MIEQNDVMRCAMYHIGICDDGETICASMENMLLREE